MIDGTLGWPRRSSRRQASDGDASGQKHKRGATKVTEYPLTVGEIMSWFRSKQRSLEGSGVSLVNIQGRDTGPKPAAFADFDAPNATGRINAWASGEFDFEALRGSDGKDIFWRQAKVSSVNELEDTYAAFLRTLQNPGAGIP